MVIFNVRPDGKPPQRAENKMLDIYRTIKERILFMEYPPGLMFNERALAEEFEISRIPLRDVLKRLEWEHLIRILPRTGSIVTELEFEKVVHAYQLRLELEGMVGRLAAEKINGEQLAEIDALEKECREIADQKNIKAMSDIDFRLRNILYGAANNPLLREVSDFLYNITIRLWYFIYEKGDWEEENAAYLNEIVETKIALVEKNPAKTGETRRGCLADHVERIKKRFLSWMVT